jgi:hypothetical protein
MRIATRVSLVLWAALLALSANAADQGKKVDLLAGDGLAGWASHLVEADVKKEDVWSLEDGILKCKGTPLGYLYTKKEVPGFQADVGMAVGTGHRAWQ